MKTIDDKTQKEVRHCWEPMKEYQLNADEVNEIIFFFKEGVRENEINGIVAIIKKLPVNQYINITNPLNKFLLIKKDEIKKYGSFEYLNLIIENLKKEGLDIGKGNCKYGYKMPIIDKKTQLRIFRRN